MTRAIAVVSGLVVMWIVLSLVIFWAAMGLSAMGPSPLQPTDAWVAERCVPSPKPCLDKLMALTPTQADTAKIVPDVFGNTTRTEPIVTGYWLYYRRAL